MKHWHGKRFCGNFRSKDAAEACAQTHRAKGRFAKVVEGVSNESMAKYYRVPVGNVFWSVVAEGR